MAPSHPHHRPHARANLFRFSSKYQDHETDLMYYGYRYYAVGFGRWLTKDPLSEPGAVTGCEKAY